MPFAQSSLFPAPGAALAKSRRGRFEAVWLALVLAFAAAPLPLEAAETYVRVISGVASDGLGDDVQPQQADTDTDGRMYVAGALRGPAQFGPGVAISRVSADPKLEPHDAFLGLVGTNGGWSWARRIYVPLGGTYAGKTTPRDTLTITSVRIGAANVYVTGRFQAFDGGTTGFVTKLTPSGDVVWTRYVVGDPSAVITSVVEGAAGAVYFGGTFTGNLQTVALIGGRTTVHALANTPADTGDFGAFVVKTDASAGFTWFNSTTSLQAQDEEVVAMEIDGAGDIHVLMNLWDNNSSGINIRHAGGTLFRAKVDLEYTRAPWVGKLGADGFWKQGRALGASDLAGAAFNQGRTSSDIQARDLKLVNGKVFVCGGAYHLLNGTTLRHGFITRLSAVDYLADGAVAHFWSGDGDKGKSAEITRMRSAGGTIFVAGLMPQTLEVYGEIPPTAADGGASDMEITSLTPNYYVGALDAGLKPLWLRTTSRADAVPLPDSTQASLLAVDAVSRRVYWGGRFRTANNQKLLLGEPASEMALSNFPSTDGAPFWGWITAFGMDGKPVRQVRLVVDSKFGAIVVNGTTNNLVNATTNNVFRYDERFFEGAQVRVSVADQESFGTRNTVSGYTLDNQQGSTPARSFSTTLLSDTQVTFSWKVQHRLRIQSQHADKGLSTLTSPGNPVPLIGDSWVDDGQLVDAEIDGWVQPGGAGSWGTRYVVSGYDFTSGTFSTNRTIPPSDLRVRVAELKNSPMTNAVTITYLWKKQHRVNVQTSNPDAAGMPLVRQTSAPVAHLPGTGDQWCDDGAAVDILARATNPESTLVLKGWDFAEPVPDLFSASTFTARPESVSVRAELLGDGGLSEVVVTNVTYFGVRVPKLTRPATVVWNFGDPIQSANVAVGVAFKFPNLGNRSPSSAGWSGAVQVLDGPPGSIGDDMLVWDPKNQSVIPTRPGISQVQVPYSNAAGTTLVVWQIYSGFHGEVWRSHPTGPNRYNNPAGAQRHVASTPPVDLDPSPDDRFLFKGLRYSDSDATGAEGRFRASGPGRSVLLYSVLPEGAPGQASDDRSREDLVVRVVETVKWDADGVLRTNADAVPIGSPLASTHDVAGRGTGFVVHENANYNPDLYDRASARGPIIPVNSRMTPPDLASGRELVVVWYEPDLGAQWPARPVFYPSFAWPSAQGNRIVIASRLGSEGLDGALVRQLRFEPEFYEDVRIYNQPDPDKAGYNPNEEHARIYPSMHALLGGRSVPAAFALRDDLNVTSNVVARSGGRLRASQYTSDPYVLVQYREKATQKAGMAIYAVQRSDPGTQDPWVAELPGATGSAYAFSYAMVAGERVTAPYPLNQVMGLVPCINDVPNPLTSANTPPNGSFFEAGANSAHAWFVDHKNGMWAVAGDALIRAYFFYPIASDFWYPFALDARAVVAGQVGDCIPWLPAFNIAAGKLGVFDQDGADFDARGIPVEVTFATRWPEQVPVLKVGETLTYAGGEAKADNPDAPGLPGILGFAAAEVVFDSRNPFKRTASQDPSGWYHAYSARVISPLGEHLIPVPITDLPAGLNNPASPDITVEGSTWYFNKLSPSLRKRVFYRPLARLPGSAAAGVLGLRGFVNDRTLGAGDLTAAPPPVYVLEPNVLSALDAAALKEVGSNVLSWAKAVDSLRELSRNPGGILPGLDGWKLGLEAVAGSSTAVQPRGALGPGLALVTNPRLLDPAFAAGAASYVTIAENNHESLGDAPVSMHVIRIDPNQRYRGAIKTLLPPNVFDEKITLRHTADFGGNVEDVVYAWWYREEDGKTRPGDVPPGGVNGAPLWEAAAAFGGAEGRQGLVQIELDGNPTLLLADNLFFTHYRYGPNGPEVGVPWSDWAGAANSTSRDLDGNGTPDYRAQLATGWVKRVLDGINPYEARIREFGRSDSPATASSLLRQLGAPYVGPVALNAAKDVVENLGLIELYETVLRRARDMTVDASNGTTSPGINAAILLASTRLAEFYTLLANEAWGDASDPTIGYGGGPLAPGALSSARFCFENQQPTLLGEELALLRGVDESYGRPVFNRLFWNFTKGEGEVAYALNYQIADVTQDGFIDENDALKQYPMGHGDAWGHFLSAMRKRYDLLRIPLFDWEARGEYYNLLDVVIGVDFNDEVSFARTAAARARVGAEIVQLTFQSLYSEAPDAKLTGYTDPDTGRAWGVTEWSRRTAQAAYFDWVTANALLPLEDPRVDAADGRRLDRRSVAEIGEIALHLNGIQVALDGANSGLNPLGLDPDVLPFDIDPTHIDVGSTAQIGRQAVQGLSHYEQLFERAYEAMRNASLALGVANERKFLNRQVEETADGLRRQALAQDREFRNRLIEIFGTPYAGQIGAGKAYPAGYAGPDLNLFMYVDVNAIKAATIPVANPGTYFDEYVSFHALTNDIPEEFRADITEHFLNDISIEGNTAVELLGDDRIRLKLPARAQDYTFVAPEEWGRRAAPGRLQALVGEMLQAEAELSLVVGDYDFLVKQARDRVELLKMRAEADAEILGIEEAHFNTLATLTAAIDGLRALAASSEFTATIVNDIVESTVDSLPKSVDDFFFGVRFTVRTGMAAQQLIQRIGALIADQTANIMESSKDLIALRKEIDVDHLDRAVELRGMLHDVEEILVNEGVLRIRMFAVREQLRGLLDQYRATLEEGSRLVEERRNANLQVAAAVQGNRYHDLLFRTGRHESIQRYRTLFDLARRYCYMAAKAFDYETNLDPSDRASARPYLEGVVRERSLGTLGDNIPAAGPGLAGVMARLQDNFRAIEGRLGFNNFQFDVTEFSLRDELVRPADDAAWKTWLTSTRVPNLWDRSEFRQNCRPFGPPAGATPGLVISFGTTIQAGRNFFDKFLTPGDSAYDPSLYATKIRGAGIRFVGYPLGELARTPYVYLVPAGMDTMLIPNSPDFETRSWNVVDQAIPVPHPANSLDLLRPAWLPNLDSLSGNLREIRRFSSFRAAVTDDDPSVNATRFIGRSVWNSRWYLIIPGQTFDSFAEQGLDRFINSVTDIRITFETYGYSGN